MEIKVTMNYMNVFTQVLHKKKKTSFTNSTLNVTEGHHK